jgi:hypothetical protein
MSAARPTFHALFLSSSITHAKENVMNTQPTSALVRIVRRITVAATAIGVTALTFGAASPVQAALTADAVLLDSDHVVVRDPMLTANSFTTDAHAHLDRGTIRVGMYGTLVRSTSSPGCRAARAVFTYADGSTSSATSARVCKEFNTYLLRPSLSSDASRQVVRYAVQLLAAADSTAPLTVIGGNTEYVGDAPGSTGTAARLDHDTHVLTITGSGRTATMFTGSTDYFLQKHEVSAADFTWWTPRARVTGTLTWSDLITGTEAYLSVGWTYADGSTSSTISEKVVRASLPSRTITLTSSSTKQVIAVSMAVYSNQAGLGSFSNGSQGRFGDPTTP